MSAAAFSMEPEHLRMTGPRALCGGDLLPQFTRADCYGALDAPEWIAQGSVECVINGPDAFEGYASHYRWGDL